MTRLYRVLGHLYKLLLVLIRNPEVFVLLPSINPIQRYGGDHPVDVDGLRVLNPRHDDIHKGPEIGFLWEIPHLLHEPPVGVGYTQLCSPLGLLRRHRILQNVINPPEYRPHSYVLLHHLVLIQGCAGEYELVPH